MDGIRGLLVKYVDAHREELIRDSVNMVRIPSEDPPSNTHGMVDYLISVLKDIEGLTLKTCTMEEPRISLVAWLKGNGKGKRVVFNGHIDTFLVGETAGWTEEPFSGAIREGRIYGRGSCDMKASIAGYITMLRAMAEYRNEWSGEICVTFASDEESAGMKGTDFILDTVPEAWGDVMINGDVGSPRVLKFGEKGFLDLEVTAEGIPAHGLHKYKGINAIDRLMDALKELEELEKTPVTMPKKVLETILEGKSISEEIDRPGEVGNMQMVTVNIGCINGGYIYSTIPAKALAQLTIGIPIGSSLEEIKEQVRKTIAKHEGVSSRVISEAEPNWTDPDSPIFGIMKANAEEITGQQAVISLRSGFDDSRFYRYRGIPAVLLGVTEYNMGAPDENFLIEDMIQVTKIFILSAYDFLCQK